MARRILLATAIAGLGCLSACQREPGSDPPLQVALPKTPDPAPTPSGRQVRLFCDLDATRIELNGRHWQLPAQPAGKDLQPLIEALGEDRASTEVILYADAKVPYARLVAVMDALKAAGLSKLMVAVPKEQAP